MTCVRIDELVHGRRGMTPDTALRLEKLLYALGDRIIYFRMMHHPRGPLTIHVVPLTAAGGDDLSQSTTPAQRLALVEELTREAWALAGWSVPTYTRAETPIRVAPLTRTPAPARPA